jgi:hypothetical protein
MGNSKSFENVTYLVTIYKRLPPRPFAGFVCPQLYHASRNSSKLVGQCLFSTPARNEPERVMKRRTAEGEVKKGAGRRRSVGISQLRACRCNLSIEFAIPLSVGCTNRVAAWCISVTAGAIDTTLIRAVSCS